MSLSTRPPGTLFNVSNLKKTQYDVICIGSGWAARALAPRVVAAGLSALIVETALVGGDCPFWACVPSKALLRPGEALDAAQAVQGAKERIQAGKIDAAATFNRRNNFTANWNDEELVIPMNLATGVDILRGTGQLAGVKKVSVVSKEGQTVELSAKLAVALCTGSAPVIPNIPGLKEANPWTPKEAMSSSTVPDHLAIIGGGVVGCETATIYSMLGAKVTVISHSAEILPNIDPEAGKLVREALEADGVQFFRQTTVTGVERKQDSTVVISTIGSPITASEVLVAVGRIPQADGCGLEHVGIKPDGKAVPVNDSLLVEGVTGSWLYAVGDINGRSPLTHMCKYQGRIAANTIIQQAKGQAAAELVLSRPVSASADHYAIPQVIFTNPTIAHVGLTRTMAERQKLNVRIIQTPSVTLGALLHRDGQDEGWAQWIVDSETQKLLGMTVVGMEMGELIHAGTIAVAAGLRLDQLVHAVPCFPTMSEVYLNLAEAAGL